MPGAVAVSVALGLFGQLAVTTQWWQLLIAHLTLSLGLAFMFTPLFTITLGALPPHLYGHGSAMLGTVQQVAGAAGTALFVTVMAGVAAAQPETLGAEQSLAAGARAAFLTVGAIWLVGFLATLFLLTDSKALRARRQPSDGGK